MKRKSAGNKQIDEFYRGKKNETRCDKITRKCNEEANYEQKKVEKNDDIIRFLIAAEQSFFCRWKSTHIELLLLSHYDLLLVYEKKAEITSFLSAPRNKKNIINMTICYDLRHLQPIESPEVPENHATIVKFAQRFPRHHSNIVNGENFTSR